MTTPRDRSADPAIHGEPRRGGGVNGAALDGDSLGPDYDALADLFLGESEAAAPQRPAPGRSVLTLVTSHDLDDPEADARPPRPPPAPEPSAQTTVVEGVIVGHLPVLASAWVTQYARHLAEKHHAWVGLIRLRAGHASLELIGSADSTPPSLSRQQTFDAALASAAPVARRWLIKVDELSEAGLPGLAGVDAVTLLTGADEAAVVASYRTLKLLCDRIDDGEEPRVGVAIMGAPDDRAREAADRLSRTVEAYLGRRLPLTACITRIGPGRSIELFRGTQPAPTEKVLAALLTTVHAAPAASGPGPEPAHHVEPKADRLAPAEGQPPAPAALPASACLAPARAARGDTSLASLIPGLRGLPAPCPAAPAVELALDGAGRVHALARVDGPDGRVMEQLMAASAWAGAHAAWIRLASGGAGAGGNAVAHVFTEDPRPVRRLLDTDARVHLLVRVRTGERDILVCRDLN